MKLFKREVEEEKKKGGGGQYTLQLSKPFTSLQAKVQQKQVLVLITQISILKRNRNRCKIV